MIDNVDFPNSWSPGCHRVEDSCQTGSHRSNKIWCGWRKSLPCLPTHESCSHTLAVTLVDFAFVAEMLARDSYFDSIYSSEATYWKEIWNMSGCNRPELLVAMSTNEWLPWLIGIREYPPQNSSDLQNDTPTIDQQPSGVHKSLASPWQVPAVRPPRYAHVEGYAGAWWWERVAVTILGDLRGKESWRALTERGVEPVQTLWRNCFRDFRGLGNFALFPQIATGFCGSDSNIGNFLEQMDHACLRKAIFSVLRGGVWVPGIMHTTSTGDGIWDETCPQEIPASSGHMAQRDHQKFSPFSL